MFKRIVPLLLLLVICFSPRFSLAFSYSNSTFSVTSLDCTAPENSVKKPNLLKPFEKDAPANLAGKTGMKYEEGAGGGGGGGGGGAAGLGAGKGKSGQAPKGGHDKSVRPSTKNKHERADARRQKEQRKAEEKRQKNKKKK